MVTSVTEVVPSMPAGRALSRPVENCAVSAGRKLRGLMGWLVGDLLSFASEPEALAFRDNDLGVAWRARR